MQARNTIGPMSLRKNTHRTYSSRGSPQRSSFRASFGWGREACGRLLLVLFPAPTSFQVEQTERARAGKRAPQGQPESEFIAHRDTCPRIEEIGQVVVRQIRLPKRPLDLPMPIGAGTVAEPVPRRKQPRNPLSGRCSAGSTAVSSSKPNRKG